jgi:hypothetical protein
MREEFRRYLEKTGVLKAMTKALLVLFEEEEKPIDPVAYFITKLTLKTGIKVELEDLQAELKELEKEVSFEVMIIVHLFIQIRAQYSAYTCI